MRFRIKIKEAIATIFASESTAAVTTIESESGVRHELPQILNFAENKF